MTIEQILIGIIVLLVGIIIGGTGGQALVKRTMGNVGQSDNTAATAASAAATAAASAAATAAASLDRHVAKLDVSVGKQWDLLNEIRQQQTKMAATLEQFPEMCKLKHEQVDREQTRIQTEIDALRARA